jgi:glucokinase
MDVSHPNPVLVADVGGTNLNLALLGTTGGRYTLLRKSRFRTLEERSIAEPIRRFLAEAPGLRPLRACLAGAGPVVGGRIHLTNAPWDLDGPALEQEFGFPVRLVNDFTALACGTLLLDLADPSQVTALPHGACSLPAADPDGLVLAVGAGTGLGVGFVVRTSQGPRVFPSEGGHIGLPVFDDDSRAFWQYAAASLPGPPGAEVAVCGQGLALLLRFLLETGRTNPTPTSTGILSLPPTEQPAAISAQAAADPVCAQAMARFVAYYARVCADLCAAFLPTGGLFLAGGIVAKNAGHFTDGRFMAVFERNYKPHLDRLTHRTPVFLVHDYDLSLYGAAHAPFCLG